MKSARRYCGVKRLANLVPAVFLAWYLVSLFLTFSVFASANIFKVQNVNISELSGLAEGQINDFNETDISSSVTFHKLNDSAKFTITLKNTDSKNHEIESISVDGANDYVDYELSSYEKLAVDAGGSFDFDVVARYSVAVEDIESRSQLIQAKITIKYLDEETEDEIAINPVDVNSNDGASNPSTHDEVLRSIVILALSTIALIVVTVLAVKGHKKAYKFVGVLVAAVCTVSVASIVRAVTMETESFVLVGSVELNDKLVVSYELDGDISETIVPYGESLTNLPEIPPKEDYEVEGWLDEDGELFDAAELITSDKRLTASYKYVDPYPIVWNFSGTCDFSAYKDASNNSHGRISGDSCTEYAGQEYIDTGIALYNAENIDKDFEVSFTINHFDPSEQLERGQETVFTDKGYDWKPGVVYRLEGGNFHVLSRRGDGNANKEEEPIEISENQRVSIMRYQGDVYYSIDDSAYVLLQENASDIDGDPINIAAWFGAAPNDVNGTVQKRFITGSLSDMSIRLGKNKAADLVQVTFNANGGNLKRNQYFVERGEAIGALPKPARSQQVLVGWFDESNQQISADTIIDEPTTYKAKWITSVEGAYLASSNVEMAAGETEQIRISNQASIEPIKYSSSDDSVARVDADTDRILV